MALSFPASPTIGDTYEPDSGQIYTWDGVKWTAKVVDILDDIKKDLDTKASTGKAIAMAIVFG